VPAKGAFYPRTGNQGEAMAAITDSPTLLLLAGVLLFLLTIFRIGRRGSKASPLPAAAPPKPTTSTLSVARVADDLEVKLYNTFRELNARLENKIQVLNDLIIESDSKIRRLEQLQEKKVASANPTVLPIDRDTVAPPLPPSERFAEIYQMEDRGMTPAEISQRVDQSLAEIQLILGLRNRRKSG
jgi:hypothetical protein